VARVEEVHGERDLEGEEDRVEMEVVDFSGWDPRSGFSLVFQLSTKKIQRVLYTVHCCNLLFIITSSMQKPKMFWSFHMDTLFYLHIVYF
jgi:hypothetical protein